MINLIFKNNKNVGYATVGYSSSDDEEVIIKKSEEELNTLLAPILEADETWRDKYRYLELDDSGNVIVNEERYQQDQTQ